MTNSHKLQSFNISVIGESHIKKELPCQDASLAFDDPVTGLHVAIVSDGHGSRTYVRSDRGSQLAVEVTRRVIIDFVDSPDTAELFAGRAGRVTTMASDLTDSLIPIHNPLETIPDKDKTETQLEEAKQNRDYHRQVEGIEDVEKTMRALFGKIYTQWLEAINDDAKKDPLSVEELTLLGGKRLVKAYGATLMAFVVTPSYWFAFHLGDGKMVAYDSDATWYEPVPWDHKCFLNLTTSLCQSDCVERFRYAFDGTGSLPLAVFLGSDGLDDTWQTMELLEGAYLKMLSNIADDGIDSTKRELRDNVLPQWSKHGSTDDMSVAAIVDIAAIGMMRDIWDEQRKAQASKHDLDDTQVQIDENSARLKDALEELRRFKATVEQLEQEILRLETEKERLTQKIEQHNDKIQAKKNDFTDQLAALSPEPFGHEQEPVVEPPAPETDAAPDEAPSAPEAENVQESPAPEQPMSPPELVEPIAEPEPMELPPPFTHHFDDSKPNPDE